MRSIFISYRREDSEGQAGRLYEGLSARFGEDRVFMDVAAIRAGRDFRREIEERVASCAVLLVVIGQRWLEARDGAGQRRLDNPADFVRLETASALARQQVTVVPVLVGGARMPEARDLPDDLKDLVFRNAVPLTHQRWDSDLDELVNDIEDLLVEPDDRSSKPAPLARGGRRARRGQGEGLSPAWRWAIVGLAAITVVALAGVGYNLYEQNEADKRYELAQKEAAAARASEAEARALADAAAASAAAAAKAASEAQARAEAAAQANAEEKARLEKEAADLALAQQQAQQKAEEARRVEAEAKAAEERARQRQDAAARLAKAPQPAPAAGPRAPGRLDVANWPLKAGCAGSEITVTGTAGFFVAGGNASVRFTGSGSGYTVEMAGDAPADKPQGAYEVTARGTWQGPRPINAQWTVRFEADANGAVRAPKHVRLQSSC